MVKDGEVLIVDEFTGRLMPGRRWSDGLHQAIEAKENVKIERENQTLATITFQNYFRMYKKFAGMTGTAETEAPEFERFTDSKSSSFRPIARCCAKRIRTSFTARKKKNISRPPTKFRRLHESNQPVLVGTTSIEKSERLSELLKKKGI